MSSFTLKPGAVTTQLSNGEGTAILLQLRVRRTFPRPCGLQYTCMVPTTRSHTAHACAISCSAASAVLPHTNTTIVQQVAQEPRSSPCPYSHSAAGNPQLCAVLAPALPPYCHPHSLSQLPPPSVTLRRPTAAHPAAHIWAERGSGAPMRPHCPDPHSPKPAPTHSS